MTAEPRDNKRLNYSGKEKSFDPQVTAKEVILKEKSNQNSRDSFFLLCFVETHCVISLCYVTSSHFGLYQEF